MNDQKMIKKVFSLAWYDFSNNFEKWFSITGLLAVMVIMLMCEIIFITSDYFSHTSFFQFLLQMNRTEVGFYCSSALFMIMTFGIPAIILLLGSFIVIQNALDLAFDSSMQGFSLNRSLAHYIAVMAVSYSLLFIPFTKIINVVAVLAYMPRQPWYWNELLAGLYGLCVILATVYLIQWIYLLSMHLIEYKKGIWQSCKDMWAIMHGKIYFLSKIVLLQILISVAIGAAIYFGLSLAINVILPMIMWFFKMVDVVPASAFITIVSKFFYIWAYILLYSWLCLVLAHVYRQLICPPVDNPSCLSCSSCK